MSNEALAAKIRDVPDFPKPGIVFKDIMPLVADPTSLRQTIDLLAEWARPREPDIILGAEARGFIFGGALAYELGCGFVAARKPGTDSLQVHADSLVAGQRVIVLDDVLATGGTARAKIDLVEQLDGTVVGALFVIELTFLSGREKLGGYDVHALISY